MNILMCDGPLNGEYYEVQTAFCPLGHESPVESFERTPHCEDCGEEGLNKTPVYFEAGGSLYSLEWWDITPELVGSWVGKLKEFA